MVAKNFRLVQSSLFWAMTLALLSACASNPGPSKVVVEDRVIVDGDARALEALPELRAEPLKSNHSATPVVIDLLAQADQHIGDGNIIGAAQALERAIRIEPRNPLLWSKLARVRFDQDQWSQASQFAAKSNTLVRGDKVLQRQNWYLMMRSYENLGAEDKADYYRQKLAVSG